MATAPTAPTAPDSRAEAALSTLKSELRVVTPEIAKALRETCQYDRQRPISDAHVARLADEMQASRFIQGTQIHLVNLADQLAIINGNHTLEAVIASGLPQALTLLYTDVRNEDEAARLYARHDIGRSRNWADMTRASGLDKVIHLDKNYMNKFGGAIAWIICDFNDPHASGITTHSTKERIALKNRVRSRDIRMDIMRDYREAADMYVAAVTKGRINVQRLLQRAAVFSVGLETFKHQPSLGGEFWETMALDDGLKRNDPRKRLLNYLGDQVKYRAQPNLSRIVAFAWNAFFDKQEEIGKLQGETSQPFVLKGTPWTGKKAAPVKASDVKTSKPVLKTGVGADGRAKVSV